MIHKENLKIKILNERGVIAMGARVRLKVLYLGKILKGFSLDTTVSEYFTNTRISVISLFDYS
jgi:hypothetical protein